MSQACWRALRKHKAPASFAALVEQTACTMAPAETLAEGETGYWIVLGRDPIFRAVVNNFWRVAAGAAELEHF